MDEPWLKEWFPRIEAAPRTLAFDIGANVGDWTAILSPAFQKVVSVEPDTRCQPPDPNDHYERRAVWSHTGRATLYQRDKALQSSLLPDHKIGDGDDAVNVIETSEIDCVTLDDLAAEHGEPDFIKMDIEGGETYALLGATKPCFSKCLWLIEIHDTREAVLNHMQRLGYPTVRIIEHPYKNAAPGHEWMLAEPK